ncbi:hypothetical protein [Corynebacterium vitaeruminis]|uniref:hypothetical protein n=1 Tax=Corynebacterium vitaeruminis TaxID=38305 RepID=UPI000660CE46|nr:hypothetical protein [Corynebacterium vitaeruminis]
MSTVAAALSGNSASNTDFSQGSELSTRSTHKTPLVWGERSASRTQHTVRPGQRARIAERNHSVTSLARVRLDRSRPSHASVDYGQPSLSISKAQQPIRRDVSAGANLTRLMAVWALGIGAFFGIFGSVVFEQGQSEAVENNFTPTYASYSAQ